MPHFRYQLDKRRPTKCWICPNCGKKALKRYVDQTSGAYLADHVGRCNREINCGYHLTPSAFFKANPNLEIGNTLYRPFPVSKQNTPLSAQEMSTIPLTIFAKSLAGYGQNYFAQYLERLFHRQMATSLIGRFQIGTSKHWPGATVFWQIDTLGNIRTGKIMLYHPHTGKRIKAPQARISWVHAVLGLPNYRLAQCLFGEHQLSDSPADQIVAIVESEKTAILMSAMLPEYTWLATGGLHNLAPERCGCLSNRQVMLFPDLNAWEHWEAKASALRKCCENVVISDLLERMGSTNDRAHGLDLADYSVIQDPIAHWALAAPGYPLFWDFAGFSQPITAQNIRNTDATRP